MKKTVILILILAMALSLAACGAGQDVQPLQTAAPTHEPTEAPTEAPTQAPTEAPTEPAPTEPHWEPARVRVGEIGILLCTFQRGEQVTVLGRLENHYIVQTEVADLLVETRLLRLEGEDIPAETGGWAHGDTAVYSTANLTGEVLATLSRNTQVTVLDAKDDWALIQWSGSTGYVKAAQLSASKLPTYQGGGSQDGTDVDIGGLSTGGVSGGIVLLGAYHGGDYEVFDAPVTATVLSNGTQGLLQLVCLGQEVKVTEAGDSECTVLVGQLTGTVPSWALCAPESTPYEVWDGFARSDAKAYTELSLRTDVKAFRYNEQVQVIDHLEELQLYIIELDGQLAYVPADSLSATRLPTGTGGSGGTDWTPPAL